MQSTPSEPAPSDSSIIRAGSDGRLRFTPAQRQELLDAFDRSGLSAMAFARGHGICYQTFIAWQRKRREQPTLPATHSGPAFAPPPNFPIIVLPFSGRKRRLRLEKMAYHLTTPASGKSAMRPKNRVWGFSRNDRNSPLENRRRCPELRRKSRPTPTIFTPGIPQWPSRDPIGERGGVNLYGFVGNRPLGWIDDSGAKPLKGRPVPDKGSKRWTRNVQQQKSAMGYPLTPCCDRQKLLEEGYRKAKEAFELTMTDTIPDDTFLPEEAFTSVDGYATYAPLREYCGLICCNKNERQIKGTDPHPGRRDVIDSNYVGKVLYQARSCDPLAKGTCAQRLGRDWTTVAAYHSHPRGDRFSKDDWGYINTMLSKLPLFLASPDDSVKIMEVGPAERIALPYGSMMTELPKISIVSSDGGLTPVPNYPLE